MLTMQNLFRYTTRVVPVPGTLTFHFDNNQHEIAIHITLNQYMYVTGTHYALLDLIGKGETIQLKPSRSHLHLIWTLFVEPQ